ncbi:MAG: hypothetical protein NVS1B11_07090 [Terriglobales bacterium]
MATLKLIFGVFLIGACVYLGAKVVPIFFANYQFEDAIKTQALMSTNNSDTDDVIRESIFKKAQDLEVPITKENIRVKRVGTQGYGSVTIEAPYTVHLEVPGYSTDLHFDPTTTNKSVL